MRKLLEIIWLDTIVYKLSIKHQVETFEVQELINQSNPHIRRVKKGNQKGEDLYMALGQLKSSGRYLVAFYIKKPVGRLLIISARDMDDAERKLYEQAK